MKPGEAIEVVIARIHQETSLIRSFVLQPMPGQTLPAFEAGAHIDVALAPGMLRSYALVNDPADGGRYVLGVKREINGRGGSIAMHQLKQGDTLTIFPPRNRVRLRETPGRVVFLAAGIGVAPLISMAQALSRAGTAFEFHYFTSSREERAFCDLINGTDWARAVAYHYCVMSPALCDLLEDILGAWAEDATVYLCGPEPFMEAVCEAADKLDWPKRAVVLERFSAPPVALEPGSAAFVVRLAKRDIDLIVPPEKSIVEVLQDAGIDIPTNCEQGICGTCVTSVREGDPAHHDMYLTDEEHASGKIMTPCVSRSKSKVLVLDL